MDSRIFLSYSWDDKKIANEIEELFSVFNITIERDERKVQYTESIKEFMKTVRVSDYVLMIISDSYLKSTNCMYEVLEFVKDESYKGRVLPLIHKDLDIFGVEGRVKYSNYWKGKLEKLNKLTDGLERTEILETLKDIRLVKDIYGEIDEFLGFIKNINNIIYSEGVKQKDFEKIAKRIGLSYDDVGYYIISKIKTISYKQNTFIWWLPKGEGYTIELKDAGVFTLEQAKEIVHDPHYEYSRTIAIPVGIANKFFNKNQTPYNDHYFDLLIRHRRYLIGDMNWDLPRIYF